MSKKEIHAYFDPLFKSSRYKISFWDQLQSSKPELFNRNNTLHILKINKDQAKNLNKSKNKDFILEGLVENNFKNIINHGYFAVIIEASDLSENSQEWELSADIIFAAEKFNEKPLNKSYFKWQTIEKDTVDYIKKIKDKCDFKIANEGFSYKDTFILTEDNGSITKLLLIFEKNERDETLIPCPACRTNKVRGNSYSSLGVKSWECCNLICPDRSKYNRGKRYSFRSLLFQESIKDSRNTIPGTSVKKWLKDVVVIKDDSEILDMLVRHYSIHGDTVHTFNFEFKKNTLYGRSIIKREEKFISKLKQHSFKRNFTKKYLHKKEKSRIVLKNIGDAKFQVYKGDSAKVLLQFDDNYFDGGVTSPPYYNAKKYSQWPNIYCYLHDMFNINREVFRTLKSGAFYLYNIFDYFDNEKILALSAMGKKRMILSAYTIDIFRRIGFEIVGNIVWDKGDIEGKRGFNFGNFSPFYQSPFNCWEHILIFKKPGTSVEIPKNLKHKKNKIFKCMPVFKMVKGENLHGHSAPFPDEIPKLLTSILSTDSVILDPFAGSLTTARVAEIHNIKSVNIEMLEEYCELGLSLREKAKALNLNE